MMNWCDHWRLVLHMSNCCCSLAHEFIINSRNITWLTAGADSDDNYSFYVWKRAKRAVISGYTIKSYTDRCIGKKYLAVQFSGVASLVSVGGGLERGVLNLEKPLFNKIRRGSNPLNTPLDMPLVQFDGVDTLFGMRHVLVICSWQILLLNLSRKCNTRWVLLDLWSTLDSSCLLYFIGGDNWGEKLGIDCCGLLVTRNNKVLLMRITVWKEIFM